MAQSSSTNFRPDLGNFLYATIAGSPESEPISVVSALARLDIDPWAEAASLNVLPREAAVQRLADLLLPESGDFTEDRLAQVVGLVALLPRHRSSKERFKTSLSAGTHPVLMTLRYVVITTAIVLAFCWLFGSGYWTQ